MHQRKKNQKDRLLYLEFKTNTMSKIHVFAMLCKLQKKATELKL